VSLLNQKRISKAEFEEGLVDDIAQFYDDPYGFIMYALPWGAEGTLLEDQDGPDTWQKDQMMHIAKVLVLEPDANIRDATASGHGIGKTAEVAWVILWAMSTRPHLSGVVTANTTAQLQTKTWRELALWHKMLINGHWFKWAATSFKHVDHPETWFVNAVPNTEHNSEAFAGLHAKYKLIIFDEASGIPDKIWEVTEGAMTDPRSIWLVFGNPTRNTGRFVDCFTTDTRWNRRQVDSRTCKMTNKEEIAEWVKAYGEDSDFVRVRIRGIFPRAGNLQFISTLHYDAAVLRELPPEVYMHQPFVVAVDVARFGTDQSVIAIRQGRKLHELRKFREYDTMQLASETIRAIKQYKPQIVFVDAVGVGGGVVDRLRMLNYDCVEVNAGAKPYDTELYYNKRMEMADRMKAWLNHADMTVCSGDRDCRQAFIGIEYGFADTKTAGGELIRLEKKADMRRRGLPSPDEFDAIAYTFAEILGAANHQSFEPNEDSFEPQEPPP
jgi:hypothetical protein